MVGVAAVIAVVACGSRTALDTLGGGTGAQSGLGGMLGGASSGQNASSGMQGGSGGGSSGSSGGQPLCASIALAGTGAAVSRGLRRLSKREYNNVVRDLLGDTTQPANAFATEVYLNGYDNGSFGLLASAHDLVEFAAAAESLATTAVANQLPLLIGRCDPTQDEAACVDSFLSTFAPRAYRRPLTMAEEQRLRDVYAKGSGPMGMNGGGFKSGLELMLEAVLQSPSFLYREELGGQAAAGVVTLTDYEVASELSFLLTGSMPDAELFSAAGDGKLKTVADYSREVARLLALPAARPALRAFAHQWMDTNLINEKDRSFYPSWSPSLNDSLSAEMGAYYEQVMWGETGSLREFFTSPQAFVDASLATIYGVPAPAGPGLHLVTLDAKTRPGVLTRAGWLAAHSDFDNSGPVARAVFLMQSIFCAPVPVVPANVPPQAPASAAAQLHETTRQAFIAHRQFPPCAACHNALDGLGFGFEEFDALGAYRTTENTQPIDDSGNVAIASDVDGPFTGGAALEAKIVQSKQALGCFLKQVYRDAMGQVETSGADPTLAALQECFTIDSRMTDAFSALVAQPAFVLRSTSQ
jgi:hypothetical protein